MFAAVLLGVTLIWGDLFRWSRLIAIINPANVPSQRVAGKIGLRPEKRSTVFGSEQIIYAAAI